MAAEEEHWEEPGRKERLLVEVVGVPMVPMQREEAVVSDYYCQVHSAQPGQLPTLPLVHCHFGRQVRAEGEVAGPTLTVEEGEELLG